MQSSLFVQLISANDYQEGKYKKKALQEYSLCHAMVNMGERVAMQGHETAQLHRIKKLLLQKLNNL